MNYRRIGWLTGAIIIALLPWLIERTYTIAQISYPYHCESRFGFKYSGADGKSAVASEGSMQLVHYKNGNGVGTYVGQLYYLDAEGNVLKKLSIHRVLEFSYQLLPGMLKSTTLMTSRIQGDEISDDDAEKYVYPGFKVGHISFGLIVKINRGGYAAGSSHFPRAMCTIADKA